MEDLLCKLVQQAKVEAREALRQLVSNLNGLAGLHMLAHEVGWGSGCGSVMMMSPVINSYQKQSPIIVKQYHYGNSTRNRILTVINFSVFILLKIWPLS